MTLQQTKNITGQNVKKLRNEHYLSIEALSATCGDCGSSTTCPRLRWPKN